MCTSLCRAKTGNHRSWRLLRAASSSVVATPAMQKIQLVAGKQDRPLKAPQPHCRTQGRRQWTQHGQPWGGRAGQGGRREHPEPTALPTHTPSCLALQRQDIPTSTTALPSRMQERAVRQLGLTVNGTTCSLRGNSSAGRGHGDTWEQGLGHLLPVSCEEGQARGLWQSPGLAVVVPAAGSGQETSAWAGGGAGLQLCVPRAPQFHHCPSS